MEKTTQRIAVVTGGAAGIGAAIAAELGRNGVFVVTLDPVVSLDGSSRIASPEWTTAQKIVEAGGSARASDASVTDQTAVRSLFAGLVEEFGSLDAVVNVAGISRPTDFASGTEEDWSAVLSVHLDGYLNVLRAALPIMAEAGHGRILGVTSGSGWRPANTGAYGCAKRAVAALTWQIGRAAPPGVTVNALSPIALTRMVTGAPAASARPSGGTGQAGSVSTTGGLSLGEMPPPENLGPVGAYLASEDFSWCQGQVIFSGGSELALITPAHLLEVCRTTDVASLPHALRAVLPVAFAPAEAAQTTLGASNPRYGAVFDEPATDPAPGSERVRSSVIVTDDAGWAAVVKDALATQGVSCVEVGEPAEGFAAAAEQIAMAARGAGPIDAVIIALFGAGGKRTATGGWQQILDEHAGIADDIRTDAGWARAVSDYSAQAGRPVRLITVGNATSSGGRSRAQAAAQLARSAHTATADRMDAFAISVETSEESAQRPVADLVAYLACSADSGALSGAELVADAGWVGLRSHPTPSATISYGGPAIPEWLDGALRNIVTGTTA